MAEYVSRPQIQSLANTTQMGAPPSEDQVADMLDNPNMQQMMNEALNNPAMIDMIIQSTPHLRDNPQARQMLNSPEFRQMVTNPAVIRQSQQMRRMFGGGAGGAGSFPAPGVTDTTPADAAGGTPNPAAAPFNPFGTAGAGAANPFAAMFGAPPSGQTPVQTPPVAPGSAGQGTPSQDAAANPFGSLFGANPAAGGAGAANPFGMTPEMMQRAMQMMGTGANPAAGGAGGANPFGMTPEMMQQAMQMMGNGGFGNMFGGAGVGAGAEGATSPAPAAPADTRPPEERYADQLRQLNDMGFYDFDRNVEALRRAGGSVQGAIEQLLS
jgi:ubiquilin